MAELYRIGNVLTESEMAAAEQLIQLSDEEDTVIRSMKNEEEGDAMITSKKIEEIFGKEDEVFDEMPRRRKEVKVVDQRQKKRRYRTIESIYNSTIPIIRVKSAKFCFDNQISTTPN